MPRTWYFYLQLLALWPAWLWFARRAFDCSDEPLGALALVTLVSLVFIEVRSPSKQSTRSEMRSLFVPFVWLLLYGFATFACPKSLQLMLALVAQLCLAQAVFYPKQLPVQVWPLLLLSVPSVATLNFYFGFPLRSLVASSSALLLTASGFASSSNGVQLFFRGSEIVIDSACSGIHMLWISLYVATLLSYLRKFNGLKTSALVIAAAVFAFGANVLRAAAITIYESSVYFRPNFVSYAHEGIGAACFVMVAVALLLLSDKVFKVQLASADNSQELFPVRYCALGPLIALSLFLALSPLLSLNREVSFAGVRAPYSTSTQYCTSTSSGVSQQALSRMGCTNLKVVALTADEEAFAQGFPGLVEKFADGHKSILVRTVKCETRQLHSSSDCYRGMGFEVKALPILKHEGIRWSRFEASRLNERVQVSECIFDQSGDMWTDVSSWYWSALLGKTKGPWCLITVATSAI
jgi:exosortase/archaeosortase family protein